MELKAVIFDMDGVLVDNRDAHIEAFMEFGKRYGFDLSRELLLGYFGMTNKMIMSKLFGPDLTDERSLELSDEKELIYREIYKRTIQPAKGLMELLQAIRRETGVKTAIGSSAQRKNIDFVVEQCQLDGYFDAIASGSEVSRSKPDPEVYLLAAGKLLVDPAGCVVFEDSFVGMEAARRAGMKVVAMATTFTREEIKQKGDYDLLIDDFTQIGLEDLKKLIR